MEARKIIITGGATRIGAAIAKKLSGKEIEILLSDSASPALITDPDQDGVIFVLMPMRV